MARLSIALAQVNPTVGDLVGNALRDGMPAMVEAILDRWFTPEFRALDPSAVDRIRQTLLATPVDGYVGCCEALRDMDQRAALAQIAAPALVIAGVAVREGRSSWRGEGCCDAC